MLSEGLGIQTYPKEQLGIDRVLSYTYFNQNGVGIAIVAREGHAADWAAYIGVGLLYAGRPSLASSEKETIQCVCEHGCKLSRAMAAKWFPNLPVEKYRL